MNPPNMERNDVLQCRPAYRVGPAAALGRSVIDSNRPVTGRSHRSSNRPVLGSKAKRSQRNVREGWNGSVTNQPMGNFSDIQWPDLDVPILRYGSDNFASVGILGWLWMVEVVERSFREGWLEFVQDYDQEQV